MADKFPMTPAGHAWMKRQLKKLKDVEGEKKPLQPAGIVYIEGEEWSAENVTGESIPAGSHVRVTAVEGENLVGVRA